MKRYLSWMQFSIEFLLKDNTHVTSKEVLQDPAAYRQVFAELYNLSCTIRLVDAPMVWQIKTSCRRWRRIFFFIPQALSAGNAASYACFEYDGQVWLDLAEGICLHQRRCCRRPADRAQRIPGAIHSGSMPSDSWSSWITQNFRPT